MDETKPLIDGVHCTLMERCSNEIRLRVAREINLRGLVKSGQERIDQIDEKLKEVRNDPEFLQRKKHSYLIGLDLEMKYPPYVHKEQIEKGVIELNPDDPLGRYDLKTIEVIDQLKAEVESW